MKRLLRSRLVQTLAILMVLASVIAIPLIGSDVNLFAYAKGQQSLHTLQRKNIPAAPIADTFTSPIPSSNVDFTIGYGMQNPNLPGLNGCYWDSTKHQYVPFNQLWHAGEDWFAKTAAGSTSISAVANGVVKYISPSGYSYPGAVIIIQHTLPDNSLVYSMYGHLDPNKILVSVNNTVTKGQIIAGGLIVQNSEGRNNTHLHWEIRYFFDGSGITQGPNYKHSCSAQPAPGYTWPGQPNNFVFNGTTYRWTNPSQFIASHSSPPTTDWPMFGFDAQQTRYNPYETILNPTNVSGLTLDWSYTAGSFTASPTVVNGIVYFGSFDNKVYALDASTGALKWSYKTGGLVDSSPAVVNGMVYVGTDDNILYALDASTGALKWSYITGGIIALSSPTVVNGVVYVGSEDGNLYALDANTGTLIWSYTTGSYYPLSPTVFNGMVYVESIYGILYALDSATGKLIWNSTIENNEFSQSYSLAVANGVVYVSSASGKKLYALDANTGMVKWSSIIGTDSNSSPAVANGVVYVGSDNTLYALDANTGTLLWQYPIGQAIETSPTVVKGIVYFGSNDYKMYAFHLPTA